VALGSAGALLLLAVLAGMVGLAALSGGLPLFVLLLALAGLVVAPATAIIYTLLDRVAPRGTAREATTWMILGYAVGGALGAALAGVAVEAWGATRGILVASAGALLSELVLLSRLDTIRRPYQRSA
jgi:predicted MFS family arabinose efflux permease